MNYLQNYKKRGVFFQVTAESYSKQYVQFYHAALRLNEKEVNSFVAWLIYGERYFQIEADKNSEFILDLLNLKPKDRDRILTIAKGLSFEGKVEVQMSLYARDSDILYFPDPTKESTMLKNLLNTQITSLHLSVKQSIHTKFIPSLIQTLNHLRRIVVTLPTRKPILDDDYFDTTEGEHDGCCEHILEPGAWCTRAIYSVAIACCDLEKSICFNLQLKVGQKPLWTMYERREDDFQEFLYQGPWAEMESRNGEIQKELTAWFKLNSNLKLINFRVFAGSPWYLRGCQ
jgi:hypothetical protein